MAFLDQRLKTLFIFFKFVLSLKDTCLQMTLGQGHLIEKAPGHFVDISLSCPMSYLVSSNFQ